jgi:hypothetical protein
VSCDERRRAAYAQGELSIRDAEAFDEHLLECASCWQAILEDRRGRHLAASGRVVAPDVLCDRVRATVALEARREPPRPRRRRPLVLAAAAVAIIGFGVTAMTVRAAPHRHPDVLTAIVRDAAAAPPSGAVNEAGLRVTVDTVPASGMRIVRAAVPFPMPPDDRVHSAGAGTTWYATVAGWNVLCINTPRPSLVIGHEPAAQLVAVARHARLLG